MLVNRRAIRGLARRPNLQRRHDLNVPDCTNAVPVGYIGPQAASDLDASEQTWRVPLLVSATFSA